MISIFTAQNKMDRKYRLPKENMYTHRFIEGLSTGYSIELGKENGRDDFFTFEPDDCLILKLLREKKHYDLSYEIEQMVNHVTYSLLMYGKAYVYLIAEYSVKMNDEKEEKKTIKAIDFEEIKGFVKKRNKDQIVFSQKGFAEKARDIKMQRNQLVEFDLRDLGYRKKYFVSILKKLDRCDTIRASTALITEKVDVYDFTLHTQKRRIHELRATKNIGWLFGTEGLSDSYILYKKMEQDKFKIKFLTYILDKLNAGFKLVSEDSGGRLVANMKEINYHQLWQDYQFGKISETELTKILYHN